MRNLKSLNNKYLLIILFFLFFGFATQSEEPIDIWKVESQTKIEEIIIVKESKNNSISQNSIYKMQSEKLGEPNIEEDEALVSKGIEIVGLYDPADNGLDINMWLSSDGEKILQLFTNRQY